MTHQRRTAWLPVTLAGCAVAGCHSVDGPYPTTQYAVALNDWQGDFLRAPATFADQPPLEGRLTYYVDSHASGCCVDTIRVFRVADGAEVHGMMQEHRATLDGRPLPQERPYEWYPSFVAEGPLDDGWYLAAFDARAYRPFGPLVPFSGAKALDDVAYARFRIGDGVDWVRTYPTVRDDTGTVDIALILSSRVPAAELEGSRVEVRHAGAVVDCTPASGGDDPTLYFGVICPGLTHGDTIEVLLVSDRVGHPTGTMQSQEILLERDGPPDRLGYAVAPELGLDVLRAAYGIAGGGV